MHCQTPTLMHACNLYHFYDGLWYDQAEMRTHDPLWEADTLTAKPTRHGDSANKLPNLLLRADVTFITALHSFFLKSTPRIWKWTDFQVY